MVRNHLRDSHPIAARAHVVEEQRVLQHVDQLVLLDVGAEWHDLVGLAVPLLAEPCRGHGEASLLQIAPYEFDDSFSRVSGGW
jgi:hypothetical protein